jgi:hypothetical protein
MRKSTASTWSDTEFNFTTNHTDHHELAVRKTILTFIFQAIFHEIKKEHESFTANIGVRVRGVRVVRGKFFENRFPCLPF